MKKKFLLIALIAFVTMAITGCKISPEVIDQWASNNQSTITQATNIAQGVAVAAAPVTGGLSLLIMQIASILLPSVVAVNRTIVAHRRAKETRQIVRAIDAAKNVLGEVAFKDDRSKRILDSVMDRQTKLAVDLAQRKM